MDTTNARITLANTMDNIGWNKLSDRQREALAIDLTELQSELLHCDLYQTALVLKQRIGGWANIESYAKCIEISYRDRI